MPSPVATVKKYWLIFRICLLMGMIRLALKWVTLPNILACLQPKKISETKDEAFAQKLAYFTDQLLRIFPANPRGNCLPRSLMLFRLARLQGFPVVFHCGVRRDASDLVGHAWLTLHDQPFLEPTKEHEQMVKTVSFPTE